MEITGRPIGPGSPVFIVADIGASHCGDIAIACDLITEAREAGADAVKFQCYSAYDVAVDSDHPAYRLSTGPWAGKRLWDLYKETETPDSWQGILFGHARSVGITAFTSPSAPHHIDGLEEMGCPAYKIASHDIVYLELIVKAASTGKPVIYSTGMATDREVWDAVEITYGSRGGRPDVAILHCVSAYPSPPSSMNISTIERMVEDYRLTSAVIGLSDHTRGHLTAQLAVAAGACIIEKHIGFEALREKSHDGGFYANPEEFSQMVKAIREAETVMGKVRYGPTESESTEFRRRLCWAKDLPAGHVIVREDILVVCGADGALANELGDVIGCVLRDSVKGHTPAYGPTKTILS